MNKKIVTLAVIALFTGHSAQAYGAATLLLYALARRLAPVDLYGSSEAYEDSGKKNTETVRFDDIIGAHKAKAALMDIVHALKDAKKYSAIGAKMPKGVLLEGPPGNGKTMLAKALAGQAGASFIAINGADFTDKWMGEGVKRVKELFAQARAKAPCIIFIDEIDAIGTRGQELGGGAQTENNRVITELLTQLDGMSTDPDKPIIVVGATNNKNLLDPALMRSGRFDSFVRVEKPTVQERKEILEFYSKKLKLADTIDFEQIAAQTKGFSGADCATLVNQAALCAVRRSATLVEQCDFTHALEACNIQRS
jgi:cell division protease FtsH